MTLYNLFELGLVVGVMSVTITRGSLFSNLRDWMWGKGEFVGNLFSCPYCISHWLSLIMVLCGNPLLIIHPYELVLKVFSVIGISMGCGWIVYKAYKGIVEVPDLSGENEALREALGRARELLEERDRGE
jgi:hypothetical protein